MSSKEFFDEVANDWDEMREQFFSERVREKAFAVADVQPETVAADIGAGTGFITEGLARRGVRVVAVDQSEEMLATMKKKFASFDGIEYRRGEAENLPLHTGAMDYVFANMYLHHVESPPEAILEMARVLKPLGRLTITDADEHNFEFLREEHHDRWLGFKREDIRSWFEQAGLKNVTVGDINELCTVDSTCGSERASISIFVASGEK
ncbi:MAG TPA: class I SAM-dependent methyltransferase [Pyrinomonadaceae bacterium]|nr:class I SAM-dependent methyltransferase [Pyrinomonadaceae bacterium]